MLFGFKLAGIESQALVASLHDDRWGPDVTVPEAQPEGAGDGSQPSDDPADPAVDGPAAEARAGADDDDEDFDIDGEDDGTGPADTITPEKLKKITNALKRAKRKLSLSRADRQRIKELKDSGLTLDEMVYRSRQHREIEDAAKRNPKLRALFSGGEPDDTPDTRPAAEPEEEFTFDETALGFDPNANQANRAIADGLRRGAKAEFMLERLMKQIDPKTLKARVDRLEGHTVQTAQATINQEWNGAIKAAGAEIDDDGVRKLFVDSMLHAKREFAGKRPATFFVDHYLKDLKVGRKVAAAASAAAANSGPTTAQRQQAGAAKVATLPNLAGKGAAPAPAKHGRETLADVRRRLMGQSPRQPARS